MLLKNVRALITGGGTGIGRATAKTLVDRGARVVITGRREDVLQRAAKETGALAIRADITDEPQAIGIVDTVVRELGDYNVLINNAGMGLFAPLVSVTAADMRRVWETNVLAATLVARESARHFITRQTGTIVNVGSTSGPTCRAELLCLRLHEMGADRADGGVEGRASQETTSASCR